jgi:hypothetical protein
MFLLAEISMVGLIAVVLVAGCGLRCVSHRPWRTIPVMLLGALAVIGGVRLINSRTDSHHAVARQWRDSIHEEVQERVREKIHRDVAVRVVPPHVDVPKVRVELPQIDFDHDFPFDHEGADFHVTQTRADTSNLMLVALGAVLVIGGVMLFARGRLGGAVLKTVTLVGLIAAGSILYSNFTSPLHYPVRTVSHSTDRVIKDTDDQAAPAALAPPAEPARPRRAKRPMERSARASTREHGSDELPPRAGEIPVAAELASGSKAPVAPAPAAPAPPAPVEAPAVAPPADPPAPQPAEAKPAETKPVEAQPAASAETKPAEPQPAEAPAAATPAAETKPADAPPAETPAPAPAAPATVPEPATAAAPAPQAPASQAPAATPPVAVTPQFQAERPAWVDMHGTLEGSVYRVAINSGPYVDVPECQRALDESMKRLVDRYIEDFLGDGAASLVDVPRAYLKEKVKRAEYGEVVESSVGPMRQLHALLEIDDDARKAFHESWRQAIVTQRLWYVGSAAAVVLALLSTFYGYLKLDLETGGAQKGRLQLAATLVALIVAAGALLARWAVPF